MGASRSRGRHEESPPGPRGSFGVGNLADYEKDRLGFLLAARDGYGPVVRLGARTTVVNDVDLAMEVLRDRRSAFGVRENFLQQRVTGAAMTARLAPRPLLNAALRPSMAATIIGLVESRLSEELAAEPGRGMAWFDPMPVLERAFSGAMAEFCFGPDAGGLALKIGALLDELGRIIGNPFAMPGWMHSPTRRRIEAHYRSIFAIVARALQVRLATRVEDERFVDLAGAIVTKNRGQYSMPRIADMLIGALLAAHRVPAAAASWMLMLAADHPLEMLKTQASPLSGPAQPREGTPSGIEATRQIVMESLRLYPATWMVARIAEEPVTLGGWAFPRGHHFLISPYVIHRDEALFPDASRFAPERWREHNDRQSALLTFGSGMHLCPGRSLAQEMLTITLARLANGGVIQREPGTVLPDPRTTLIPQGLRIRIGTRIGTRIETGLPAPAAAVRDGAQQPQACLREVEPA